MNRNETTLQEQGAPVKNTDKAFVQVGADGHSQIPGQERNTNQQESDHLVPQQEPVK